MIESMLDQCCTIMRLTETENELFEAVNTYSTMAVAEPFAVGNPLNRGRSDDGAGEAPTGQYKGYMAFDADVQAEDVLVVTDGPDFGAMFRVLSAERPRNRHTELVLEDFTGALS